MNPFQRLTTYLRKAWRRLRYGPLYRPLPAPLWSSEELVSQAARYFHLDPGECQERYLHYQEFSSEQGYAQTLGESRTLCSEEAFLVYLAARRLAPTQVVEIGVQYGKSTRRILDLLKLLNLDSRLTAFDIEDILRYASHTEVDLRLHDLTGDFQEVVLNRLAPGLIVLDAHPYYLLTHVITQFIAWSLDHPSILAIHDCSLSLYNPHMRLPKEAGHLVSSRTGLWERHVLAEIFSGIISQESGQPFRLSPLHLDDLSTATHQLRVFGTRHGLALLAPHAVLQAPGVLP